MTRHQDQVHLIEIATAIDRVQKSLARLSAAVASAYDETIPEPPPPKVRQPGTQVAVGKAGQTFRIIDRD